MRRPADPQVDLEGVSLPVGRAGRPSDEEVDAQAADDSPAGEHGSDRDARRPGCPAGRRRPRETGSPGRPAPKRRRGSGRARRSARPLRGDRSAAARSARPTRFARELLDDPAHRGELAEIRRPASPSRRAKESLARASRRASRPGERRISEDGVAFSGEALVELDDRARDARTAAAQFVERVHAGRPRSGCLRSPREATRRLPGKPSGFPTSCRDSARAGSTPFSGMPRSTASRRSSGVELKTVRNARDGSAMP